MEAAIQGRFARSIQVLRRNSVNKEKTNQMALVGTTVWSVVCLDC
jgi:hypothetical protein